MKAKIKAKWNKSIGDESRRMNGLDDEEKRNILEELFPRKKLYAFYAALPVLITVTYLIDPPEWLLIIVGGAYSIYGYSITKSRFFKSRQVLSDAFKQHEARSDEGKHHG
ncbi:hypothetical protein ACFYE9_20895 [Rhizobium leguminosarum]|uniref:Uncharacterized protein n=2 Tax=Rhizobium leguminosarum TaxID=384 RepID=A0ACD5FBP1_RHILE|nr:hypothetical protein [Rhizobium leguminosarum]